MENASKALIIAGSILLALLIISLGVMAFNNMSNSVKNNTTLDKQTIAAFNSKLTPYIGNNKSASQVNTLRQIAISINNNAQMEGGSLKYVNMKIGDSSAASYNTSTKKATQGVKASTGKFYNVKETYSENGLINEITATLVTTP